MKRRMGFFAAAVFALVAQAQTPPAVPAQTFEQRLEAVDAAAAGVRTLRAQFEQKKQTALLKTPLISSGKLVIKGERARWDTASPRKSVTVVSGAELRVYFPDEKVVEVYALAPEMRELSGSPLPRIGPLRERFDIAPLAVDGLADDWRDPALLAIELTPRAQALREHITRVRVLIDPSVPCARRVEFVDADAERTEIVFTGVRVNDEVSDDEVELRLPEGVRESRPLAPAAPGEPRRGTPPEPPR